MSSFLSVGEQQERELNVVRKQFSADEPLLWLAVEEPLNDYQTVSLATMALIQECYQLL